LEHFEEILEASDGVIIARGYLGLTLPLEDVVYVQKYLIKKCNLAGKPVMISTQIMESMVKHVIPSRSEVSDISNAVFEGIDSLILSPETAIGHYYLQATEQMSHICFEAEKHIDYKKRYQESERMLNIAMSTMKDENKEYEISMNLWRTEEAIASCAVKAAFDI